MNTVMYGNTVKFSCYDEGYAPMFIIKTNKRCKELFDLHIKFYSNYYYIINQNIIRVLFKIAQYKEKELEKNETAICMMGVLNDKNNKMFSIQEKIVIMAENYGYLLNYLKREGKCRKMLREKDIYTLKERILKESHTPSFYLENFLWLLRNPKLYLKIFSVSVF